MGDRHCVRQVADHAYRGVGIDYLQQSALLQCFPITQVWSKRLKASSLKPCRVVVDLVDDVIGTALWSRGAAFFDCGAADPSGYSFSGIYGAGSGSQLTRRWWEPDSNLWSHFEIGTAYVGANDREFVWRGLFPEWD
jgi:hypothetical protein